MFGQRPSFGGGTTSFGGFSTNTSTTGFGSTFGRPAFGAPQTTASATPFGTGTSTGTTSLFGQNQTTGGGLFGSSQSTGFGATTSGFGSTGGGLFGTSNPQTSTTGLFGSTATSTGFNANQNQQRPFSFGTPTTSSSTTVGTSLFGNPSSGGTMFSNLGQTQGTTIKYNAVTGTDTMNRSGVSQSIQTKIEVITAMKEYENKSLEELRVEDYLSGRKGASQGSTGFGFGQLGQNKFVSQPATSRGWLNDSSPGGLFGQKPPENKSLFSTGQTTGFGTSATGGIFGSTNPSPFGATTTPASTAFSFGQANQAKPAVGFPFNQTTSSQSLFGQPTTAAQSGTTFGSGFNFGSQPAQQGGLFGTQNKSTFGTTSTATNLFSTKPVGPTFGGFGATTSSSPFGTTSTSTGTGLFGNTNQNKTGFSLGTSNTGFGGTSTAFGGGGLFGANNNQPKPGGLNFGTTGTFGTPSMGFNFNQPSTATGGIFGNPSGGGLFGNTSGNLNTSSFGTSLGTGFGVNSMQPNTLGNMNTAIVSNNNINNLIKALTHNPFGSSSLLKNAIPPTGKADELLNSPTNASNNATDSSKNSTSKRPTYVLPSGSVNMATPRPVGLNRALNVINYYDSSNGNLFAGLEDKSERFSDDPFKTKSFPSVKKLNLKVFKNSNKNNLTNQNTTNGSVENENLNLREPTPLTSPITSPVVLETPTNRRSFTSSHDTSPTPDIIKGRSNIKKLQIPNKNHLNDTFTELNVASKPSSSESCPSNNNDGEATEANKENSIPVFEASVDDLPEAANISSLLPHPAGIKLSRAGYYTIPSMDDLAEMVDEDGSCLVENFTVGRYGYGNVCFQGITNVSGLDLDAFVFIVRKEVEVYPEGVEKPNIGEGLNKAAFVTLDCIWPIDKTTHEVIKSQERLDAMGWSDYLERQCNKMDASFVEYRPETGSWVFKVKHFSKYGLQDDGNEEPLPTAAAAAAAQSEVIRDKTKETLPHDVSTTICGPTVKPSLPLGTFPRNAPLFSSRNSQGPPAMGLAATQHNNYPPLGAEAVSPSTRRKVFLDGSTVDIMEEELFDLIAKEPEESASMCPLSPSAERLTLTSKATPRAIQSLKSQLFFSEVEDDLMLYQHQKGEKRDNTELTGNLSRKDRADLDDSIFVLKGFSKKQLTTSDSFSEIIPENESSIIKSQSLQPYTSATIQEDSEISVIKEETTLALRDPRSEYQLLPSGHDIDLDIGRSTIHHFKERVPLDASLVVEGNRCTADAAAFMGRSFRVGWGPGWTLVHASQHSLGLPNTKEPEEVDLGEEQTERSSPTQFLFLGSTTSSIAQQVMPKQVQRYFVHIEKIHLIHSTQNGYEIPGKDSTTYIDSMLEACLQNVLECSSGSTSENGEETTSQVGEGTTSQDEEAMDSDIPTASFSCPYFSPLKGIRLLHSLALTSTQIEDSENRDHNLSSIFKLCAALWGKLDFFSPEADGTSEYANAQARKEALSQWLEVVSEASVNEEIERALEIDDDEAYLDAVFSLLTARQISEACNLAQDKGDHHLALLLAQSCLGDEIPRQIMSQQLSNWAEAGLDAHILAPRLALYTLISGKPTHEASHAKINACLGLDWRRALALHMWYTCPTTSTIAEALEEYEKAAGLISSKESAYCEEPKPQYLASHSAPDNIQVNHDVCFQLLKLYVDPSHSLESLLEPSAITPDPMDVTASWLLWCVLQSLDYTLLQLPKIEMLHSSMAALLESAGHWHWAAFVFLCIPDEAKRKSDLSELLNRHILIEGERYEDDPFYREKEHFLLKDLHLPVQWLHRAKATRARSLNKVDEEAWYLIHAGNYNRAHTLLLDSIAPNAVINEDHDHLLHYLNELQGECIVNQVVDWSSGGGIYYDYIDVINQVNELKESRQPTGSKVEKLRPRLLALCLRLNNLKCPTPVHRLCISEMSRMVVSVLRAILGEDPEAIRVLAQQITSLPLTHECALEELNHITHQYLTHVAMES